MQDYLLTDLDIKNFSDFLYRLKKCIEYILEKTIVICELGYRPNLDVKLDGSFTETFDYQIVRFRAHSLGISRLEIIHNGKTIDLSRNIPLPFITDPNFEEKIKIGRKLYLDSIMEAQNLQLKKSELLKNAKNKLTVEEFNELRKDIIEDYRKD